MTMKRKARPRDLSHGPFNVPFTARERQILRSINDLRTRTAELRADLHRLPVHACAPPENYRPDRMEEFSDIEQALGSLESRIRWIPGGTYRFEEDEGRLP
jgi:hypothetical protein